MPRREKSNKSHANIQARRPLDAEPAERQSSSYILASKP